MSNRTQLDPDDKRFFVAVLVWIAGVFLFAFGVQQGFGLFGGHVSFWRCFIFSMVYALVKLADSVVKDLVKD